MKRIYLLPILSLLFLSINAQQVPSADAVLKAAYAKATKENKNVMVIFHASWCGWCHKMDTAINDKSCKDFFYKNYVIRYLVVDESRDKKNLENPGAAELRAKYHGDGEGIPFWLIFDKDGKLLADSHVRTTSSASDTQGENVGCPATEKEVAYFMEVLKKTSAISKAEQAAVQNRFRQNEN